VISRGDHSFDLRYPLGLVKRLSAAENAVRNMKQVAVLGEAQEENFQRRINVIRAEYRSVVITVAFFHPIL
jgi:hypothetical protein